MLTIKPTAARWIKVVAFMTITVPPTSAGRWLSLWLIMVGNGYEAKLASASGVVAICAVWYLVLAWACGLIDLPVKALLLGHAIFSIGGFFVTAALVSRMNA